MCEEVNESGDFLPYPIERAQLQIPHLGIRRTYQACLHFLLRGVSYQAPERRFQVSVEHLAEQLGCCRKTVARHLTWLMDHGWIGRYQFRVPDKNGNYPVAWTWLTEQALAGLKFIEPQKSSPEAEVVHKAVEACGTDSIPSPKPSPSAPGNRWRRVKRLPADLVQLGRRVGASRVVWLMAECRRAGVWLQHLAAAALAADDAVGYVLRALKPKFGPPAAAAAAGAGQTANAGAYKAFEAEVPMTAEQREKARQARLACLARVKPGRMAVAA